MTGMIIGIFMVEFLVKSIRIRSFRREQLHPLGFFKLVTHKEGIVLCLHPLFNVTPIQGGKSLQLLTPAECTVAISLSSVGMTTSCSATQFRKTSLPICVSRGGSHVQFKATQWANVEERRAVISVLMRLTSTRLLQFSQARGLLVWSMSKVMVVSVRQLSKAHLPSCAHGARPLLFSVS